MEQLVDSVLKQSRFGRRDLSFMVVAAVLLNRDIQPRPRFSLDGQLSDEAALFDVNRKYYDKIDSFDCLRTAMLCDFVYSSEDETINLPPKYKYISQYHDAQTGHHAKVIGEYSPTNQLSRIYLLNRGTVLTEPKGELQKVWLKDRLKTLRADVQIFFGLDSAYIKSAQKCLEHVLDTYPGIPVLVAGHSLAGAACLRSTLWAIENNYDLVSACLINPLIGSRPFEHSLTQSQIRKAQGRITYIQSEGDPLQPLLGGYMLHNLISEGIVSQIKIPALPEFLIASNDPLMGHFPEAVVVGLLRSYISPEKRQAALDMITKSYLRRPTLIETFLNKVEAQRPLYSSIISAFKGRITGATQVALNANPHI